VDSVKPHGRKQLSARGERLRRLGLQAERNQWRTSKLGKLGAASKAVTVEVTPELAQRYLGKVPR